MTRITPKNLANFIAAELNEFCDQVEVTSNEVLSATSLEALTKLKYFTNLSGSDVVSEADMAAETIYQRIEDEYSLEIPS